LNFFIEEGTWHQGAAWYASLFDSAGDRAHLGDVSPGYTMFPIFAGAAERMASLLPDVKLIYIMREPIERMRSSWVQAISDGTDLRSMHDALLFDVRYQSLSSYALQLEQYLRHFDRNQLLLVRAEDLATDAEAVVAQVFAFIGADPSHVPANLGERANISEGKVVPRGRVTTALRVIDATRGRFAALRASKRVPGWARRPLTEAESTLSDDLRERFATLLQPDLDRLHAIAGDDFPLWDLRTGVAEPRVQPWRMPQS
jgi:hypothetical protein